MAFSLFSIPDLAAYLAAGQLLSEPLGAAIIVHRAFGPLLTETRPGPGHALDWRCGPLAAVISPDLPAARAWTQALSLRLLRDAPGLTMAAVHLAPSTPDDPAAAAAALRQSRTAAAHHWPHAGFDGAGVVQHCPLTGHPASVWDNRRRRWLSEETAAKRAAAVAIPRSWLPLDPDRRGPLAESLADFCQSPYCQGMAAIVHVETGSSDRLRAAINAAAPPEHIRALAAAIERASSAAIAAALAPLTHTVHLSGGNAICPVLPLAVLGGTISFACPDGIALDFAAALIQEWHKAFREQTDSAADANASAGIAFVSADASAGRALAIAAALAARACRQLTAYGLDGRASAIDFELDSDGVLDPRAAEQPPPSADDGSQLSAKPYLIGAPSGARPQVREWEWFRGALVNNFMHIGGEETASSELQAFANAIARGREATSEFLRQQIGSGNSAISAFHTAAGGGPLFYQTKTRQYVTPIPDALGAARRIADNPWRQTPGGR